MGKFEYEKVQMEWERYKQHLEWARDKRPETCCSYNHYTQSNMLYKDLKGNMHGTTCHG